MSEILVNDLDEVTVEQLEARARERGRSLQDELKLVLEQAALSAASRHSRSAYRALADEVRASLGDRPQTDSAALLAEDRVR